MNSVTQNIGKRNIGAVAERISNYEWDTITYTGASGATVTNQDLFIAPKKTSPILQSNAFPLGIGRAMKLTGLHIEHNLRFANPQTLHAFESFSRLTFNLDDVDYSPLPIGYFLSYNRAAFAFNEKLSTTPVDTNFLAMPKGGNFTRLPRPIIIPETGNLRMTFVPGGAFKTVAVEEANGAIKLGAGVFDQDDTALFFMKFTFIGEMIRETARQLHPTVG